MVTVADSRYAEKTHEYTGRPCSSPMIVGIAVETTVDSSEASAVTSDEREGHRPHLPGGEARALPRGRRERARSGSSGCRPGGNAHADHAGIIGHAAVNEGSA
jgi:hypothetical protein